MIRRAVFRDWLTIVLGLIVFSFGVHLTIYANIGLAPWDCLGMGIARHAPFNYGIAMTLTAVATLLVDLALGERIGFGTIIDALLTGNFIQVFNDLNPFPENRSVWFGIVIMLVGFAFMAVGMRIYMGAEQGCGPRDSLLVGLGKRMPRVPFGVVEIIVYAVVLLVGFLLGGPVGIGTLISVFGAGLVMQAVYSAMRFEPRDLKHRDVVEVVKLLAQR